MQSLVLVRLRVETRTNLHIAAFSGYAEVANKQVVIIKNRKKQGLKNFNRR